MNDIPIYKNKYLTLFLKLIEKHVVGYCDLIIPSSRFFLDRYEKHQANILVLENKPPKRIVRKGDLNFNKKRFVISFIGVLRFYEVMKNLVIAIKKQNVDLIFFGSGYDERKLKQIAAENQIENVYFMGRYNYNEIHKFYNISDLIWAVYPDNIAVKKAISNKFYESLAFKKPGVYSNRTFLGQLVDNNKIGYCVDPYSIQQIKQLLNRIISDKNEYSSIVYNIKKYSSKNSIYWEDNRLTKLYDVIQ